jgi:hypothetical protein
MADRLAEYVANAQACQHTADLFPEHRMGQEYAELALRWQSLAKRSAAPSGVPA